MSNFKDNIEKIIGGDRRAFTKALSQIRTLSNVELDLLVNSYKKIKKAPLILGIVGTPGSGKSTFINQIANYSMGLVPKKNIGMLLIDPSNPINGGALLGDRIRLTEHFLDKEIFIRSISNQGSVNGLNPDLEKYLMLYSLFQFDIVIVESVGGGQSSTDLKMYVDKLILIFDPNSGDGVQHLKSGVLDVADNIIISKSDIVNVNLILSSIKESISGEAKIYSSNLNDNNALKEYFDTELTPNRTNPSKKLIFQLFRNEAVYKVDKLIQDFFSNKFNNKEIIDLSIQEFHSEFKKYFIQKY